MSEGERVWVEIQGFTAAVSRGGKVPIRPGETVLGIRVYDCARTEGDDLRRMKEDLKCMVNTPEGIEGLDIFAVLGMWYVGYLARFPEVIANLVAVGSVRTWRMEVSEKNRDRIHSMYVVLGECGKSHQKLGI